MNKWLLITAVLTVFVVLNIVPFKGEKLTCYVGMQNTQVSPNERGFPFRYLHQTYVVGSCKGVATNRPYPTDGNGHHIRMYNLIADATIAMTVTVVIAATLYRNEVKK